MSVFKRFGPGDQVDNVLVLEPTWTLTSGTSGWRGSPEGSGSVSLYGGYNRQPGGVVREYQYQRTIPGTDSFGKLARTEPITASAHYVWMTDEELNIGSRTNSRWGQEHWQTVMRLYDYYKRRDPDYTTASYDHYCVYFNSGSTNIITVYDRMNSAATVFRGIPTGSYTFEAWFKPFVTGSDGERLTVFSKARAYRLYVEGGTGKLVWAICSGSTDIVASVTSSQTVAPREWHHAAVSFDQTTGTGTLYLDLQSAGTFTSPTRGIRIPINYTGSFHIGAEWGGTVTHQGLLFPRDFENPTISAVGQVGTIFHGFIGNVRMWGENRNWTQISSSHNVRLSGESLAAPLRMDLHLSEGPLFNPPDTDAMGVLTVYTDPGLGSGVLDYAARYQSSGPYYGGLYSFSSRRGPVWHPNDNNLFYLPKDFAISSSYGPNWPATGSAPVERMRVISIPQGFTGKQIVPGSVRITDHAWDSPQYGLLRTLIDDGRGGLFLSGSAALNPVGAARATGSYVNSTSSITFEARTLGSNPNGYGITQTTLGPVGSHDWYLNESDPYNMILQVPCFDDGLTPSETMWSLYQYVATSSIYMRPSAIVAPDTNSGTPSWTLSGGTYGDPSLASSGSYRGVEWNKVGNVFYSEGLIVIKDPALLDFASPTDYVSDNTSDLLQLEFRGTSRIPVKTLMCRIDRGDLNASLNQTFWEEEEDGDRVRRHPSGSIYITTVGLYNSDHELVGVARLAEPLRVRPRDRMNIRLRMDF